MNAFNNSDIQYIYAGISEALNRRNVQSETGERLGDSKSNKSELLQEREIIDALAETHLSTHLIELSRWHCTNRGVSHGASLGTGHALCSVEGEREDGE